MLTYTYHTFASAACVNVGVHTQGLHIFLLVYVTTLHNLKHGLNTLGESH
jgi:hypothetical protein